MTLRDATLADLPALLDIHNHAVRELDAIWTEVEETLEQRKAWLLARQADGLPVVVALGEDGEVAGFGTFGQYRPKPGYRLTIEHSVYISSKNYGQGFGRKVLEHLVQLAKEQGYHLMVAVIDDNNMASVKLHESCGFTMMGHLPESGMKFGKWLGQFHMHLRLNDQKTPVERQQ